MFYTQTWMHVELLFAFKDESQQNYHLGRFMLANGYMFVPWSRQFKSLKNQTDGAIMLGYGPVFGPFHAFIYLFIIFLVQTMTNRHGV